MTKYLFDVDGTLTPSRQRIEPEFADFFLDFAYDHEVYLVTGSDYAKTLEQLGPDICNTVQRVYCCSGNAVYKNGMLMRSNEFKLPIYMEYWLQYQLKMSKFVLRTGNHIEQRIGCVNFSVVGRNATLKERALYKAYDEENHERKKIVNDFRRNFPHYMATIGGETGIDIYVKSYDKGQIIADFDTNDLMFFGDKMELDGNDYPLAKVIREQKRGIAIAVDDYHTTEKILRNEYGK